MDKLLQALQPMLGVAGRFLLGLYFALPGISKFTEFDGTTQYMIEHGVPLAAVLLPITIVLQIGSGAALIVGWQTRALALMLAGMTVAINVFMQNSGTSTKASARLTKPRPSSRTCPSWRVC